MFSYVFTIYLGDDSLPPLLSKNKNNIEAEIENKEESDAEKTLEEITEKAVGASLQKFLLNQGK